MTINLLQSRELSVSAAELMGVPVPLLAAIAKLIAFMFFIISVSFICLYFLFHWLVTFRQGFSSNYVHRKENYNVMTGLSTEREGGICITSTNNTTAGC